MKFKIFLGITLWISLLVISCRQEINFDQPSSLLRFSKDTVKCDTVYNQVRSETYSVKVYNQENKDVKIPHIYLEGGNASQYRINVDGKSGTDFTNIPLRAKDSLFIFIEIAPNSNATSAIAEDRIQFESPAGKQHVTLFSVVQDAEFFISTKANPKILDNTTWDNTKAKIIYGDVSLADGKTLNISKGTKIYFHSNSSLIVGKNSTVNVNGDLGNEVIFRGDRNDPRYDTLPKNWNKIQFLAGSTLNMNYGKVFGGSTGLEFNNAKATIQNSIIHTFQDYGIRGINSNITGQNLVMTNCGNAVLGLSGGGTYNFIHSTFANYWTKYYSSMNTPQVIYAENAYNNGTSTTQGSLNLKLQNSIAYTHENNAVSFVPTSGQVFNYLIDHCLLKYEQKTAGFNFDNNSSVVTSLQNQDPLFKQINISKLYLNVDTKSPAKGKGGASAASIIPVDILKISRTTNPTIGAYQ